MSKAGLQNGGRPLPPSPGQSEQQALKTPTQKPVAMTTRSTPDNQPPFPIPDQPTDGLHVDKISPKQRTPMFVYTLTIFSAIGGFLFGYDTGVISGAMILLRDYFLLNSVWQEMVVSATIGAAAVFALVGGFLNDRFGRKPVILVASLVFTAGALCMALAYDKYLLLVGRLVVGAGVGLASTTIPVYIAECAPAKERGFLSIFFQLSITVGILIAYLVDGAFVNVSGGWRYMLGLGGVPSIIQFIGFLFMPESPRYLISKGKDDQAREVLHKIRGEDDIEEEFYGIKQTCEEMETELRARSGAPIIWQMLMLPATRRALLIGCSLQMFQQIAGVNTVMYYSATIIKMSGVKSAGVAIWLSAITAAVNFIFTFFGLYLVERIGRRPLTIGSLIGVVVSLAWLAIGFNLGAVNSPPITIHEPVNISHQQCNVFTDCNSCSRDLSCGFCYVDTIRGAANGSCLMTDLDNPLASAEGRCNTTALPGELTWAYDYCPTPYAWMPMVGLVLYVMFFAPGLGPMPWTINSEIYPMWARSTGNAAATATNWGFNLIISMSFLSLIEVLTAYGTFWLYACLGTVGVIVLGFFLPETKGKTLEEVEGVFARPWFGSKGQPVPFGEKSVQYVHIRGLNRDGRESELDSPE